MIFSLEGKTAVITGAAGYFGDSFCRALLDFGCNVILMGRGDKITNKVQEYNLTYGEGRTSCKLVDFYEDEEFQDALREIVSEHEVDILINNAYEFGPNTGFGSDGRLSTIPKQKFMRSLESGVWWPLLATQVIGEQMQERKTGSIINISSMYGIVSPSPHLYEGTTSFNPASYGAAKAALVHLTKYTATWLGEHGVRCNAIAPGAFPNLDSATNAPDPKILERLNRSTVLGRTGHASELQGILIFLASDASSYVTGETISVDGGWITT
jgi:NAD(P)-dependent dehydrogenase (short-subunit alcohol dehydrogenase family)